MDATKIRLSAEEAALLMKPDWILTKNRVLEKVMQLLGTLQEAQEADVKKYQLPAEVLPITPKISKGENYKGLPYLVLDYPRYFNKENILAIRALFWWGHFFSSTLQLSGDYKIAFGEKIRSSFHSLQQQEFFIGINQDPWEHHFEAGNYVSLQEITIDRFEQIINEHPFIKLSKKIRLEQWDNAVENLQEIFNVYMGICGA